MVKGDRGRRVEFADPGRSLILAKPTGAIPHKGGVRITTDSREYRILADWVATGASPPAETDARVIALEVFPAGSIHHIGETQQIVLRARYSDGRTEDITSWVKWSSADEAVCRVDENGVATVVGPGEGAVVAWYASRIAIARITVPYPDQKPAKDVGAVVDRRKPRNFIDEQIDKQLTRLNLPASPACDDAEFIRRATVDTIGLLPTADEVRAFLADSTSGKRDALIDRLLARPEFVDYWTYKWCDVLTLTSTRLMPEALKTYYAWVRGQVAANTPWDQFVREILLATGDSLENGATNFYALSQSPEDMTENACQAFLGLSIGCAKCHNHPLEKWTNDQYYAMANLFARVRAKGWGGEGGGGDGRRTLYVAQSGDLIQPRTGKPQPPTPLDGRPLPFDDPADRRKSLADWLTSPGNPYFARAITNRIWANFFGVGLVEKVDDVRISNPASNEALLKSAADALIGWKFDLKGLMKAILQSNAYQRLQPSSGREPRRAPILFAVLSAADDGGGAARRGRAGHAGADEVRMAGRPGGRAAEDRLLSAGHQGDPALRRGRRELLPPVLRPEPPADRLRMRPLSGADGRPGPSSLQRQHAQRQAEGTGQPHRQAHEPAAAGHV